MHHSRLNPIFFSGKNTMNITDFVPNWYNYRASLFLSEWHLSHIYIKKFGEIRHSEQKIKWIFEGKDKSLKINTSIDFTLWNFNYRLFQNTQVDLKLILCIFYFLASSTCQERFFWLEPSKFWKADFNMRVIWFK